MENQTSNLIRNQIFYWMGILVSVIGATVIASKWINQPVMAVEMRVRELEIDRVTKEDFNRLELKVDSLLLQRGINPTDIK